jgi:hypothetical protein
MFDSIITISGTLGTILFGLLSIYFYMKSKRKVSLKFTNKECFSLFSDAVKRLNIQLNYDYRAISGSLILFKGEITNDGKVDIDVNDIKKPLSIISQDNFKWVEVKVINQSEGIKSDIKIISQNELKLEWDLLKINEFIEIEALIEIEEEENLSKVRAIDFYEGLKFDYRISNLNSIQKHDTKRKYEFLAIGIIMFVMVMLFLDTATNNKDFIKIVCSIEKDSVQKPAEIIINSSKELSILGWDKEKNISFDEFNKNYRIARFEKINYRYDIIISELIGILFGCISMMLVYYYLIPFIKKRMKSSKLTK